jgi:hypothetical protein
MQGGQENEKCKKVNNIFQLVKLLVMNWSESEGMWLKRLSGYFQTFGSENKKNYFTMNTEKDQTTYRETVFITLHGCGPVYHLLEQNYIS